MSGRFAITALAIGLVPVIALGKPRPRERFDSAILQLKAALGTDDTAAEVAVRMGQGSARGQLFALQSLLRMYSKEYGKPIDHQLEVVKALEDALGKLDESTTKVKLAKETAAPEKLVRYLEREERDALAVVSQFLISEKWLPARGGKLEKLGAKLDEIEWLSYEKDRIYLLGRLRKTLEKVAESKYNLDELETGIHEFRRNIRWFSIGAAAVGGLLAFREADGCPISEYSSLLTSPVASSPFNQLKPSAAEKPCRISKCLFLAVSQIIDDLGAAKDIGQSHEFLKDAFLKSGLATSKHDASERAWALVIKTSLAKKRPDALEVRKLARATYERMIRSNLLSVLQDEIQSCR